MKKKSKIVSIVMACVILINSVFTQAIIVSADNKVIDGIYSINKLDPCSTKYNDEIAPYGLKVDEKRITGNLKHYITWQNGVGYFEKGIKVEIYAQIYLKYIASDDMKWDKEELMYGKWDELALPIVRCCQVDSAKESAYINFTDLWNTLESVPDADTSEYNNTAKLNQVADIITAAIGRDFGLTNKLDTTTAKVRYALTNGKTANYIKYSRVKYYARYVYDSNIVSSADSMSLGILANGKRIVHKAECYWKGDDKTQKIRIESGDIFQTLGENERGCIVPLLDENGKTDYVFFSTSQGRSGQKLIGLEGNIDSEYHMYDVNHCLMILSSLDAAFDYIENGNIDETKIMNNHSKYYKCGKVVENDTEMNDDNLAYDTDPEHNKSNSTPYPVINDDGDTGEDDSNTDVVYWLKKIYKRLGAMLGVMVVDDIVDFVNDFVNSLVGDFTDAMESVTDNAESRFPFSVMYLVPVLLKVFVAEPKKPVLEYEFIIPENKALGIKEITIPLKFDKLDYIDKYVAISRNIELAAFIVYLVYYTFDVISFVRNGGMTSD